MRKTLDEIYRGYRIITSEIEGDWEARIEGIGARSARQSTAQDAINEAKRYLDDQCERD